MRKKSEQDEQHLTPKKLFLIDGIGALLSAFLSGFVWVYLQHHIGLPVSTLYALAIIALFYALYDLVCYSRNKGVDFIRGIALLNMVYCGLLLVLGIQHSQSLTYFGWGIVITECSVVALLVYVEFSMASKWTKKNKPFDLINWQKHIEQNTNEFLHHFKHLSAEQLNWKPCQNAWSIAQNIDHIIVVNTSYFSLFESIASGDYSPPWGAKIYGLPGFIGKLILASVQPEERKKLKTFSLWEPNQSQFSLELFNRFETHQTNLIERVKAASAHIERNTIIASPAGKYIVYPLDVALEIILAHEQRHLVHAIEIKSQLN